MLTIIGLRYDEAKSTPKRNVLRDIFATKIYIDGVLQEERIYNQYQKLQFDTDNLDVEVKFQHLGRRTEIKKLNMRESEIYYYVIMYTWPIFLIAMLIVIIGFFLSYFIMLVGVVVCIMYFVKNIRNEEALIEIGKSKEGLQRILAERMADAQTSWTWRKKNKNKK